MAARVRCIFEAREDSARRDFSPRRAGERSFEATRLSTFDSSATRPAVRLCGSVSARRRGSSQIGPREAAIDPTGSDHPTPHWTETLDPNHGGSTADRAERAAQAYFGSTGSPLALILDDADYCDRESRRLVEAFLSEIDRRVSLGLPSRGLALFVSSRPSTSTLFADPGRVTNVRELRRLRRKDSRALLETLLRPVRISQRLAARFCRECDDHPLLVRRAARFLRDAWGKPGVVGTDAELPASIADRGESQPVHHGERSEIERAVLTALAHLARPSPASEVAIAIDAEQRSVEKALRALLGDDIVRRRRDGRRARWEFTSADAAPTIANETPLEVSEGIHRRMVDRLRRAKNPSTEDLESLARHLLALGRRHEARSTTLDAAARLRTDGHSLRALRLLGDLVDQEVKLSWRIELVEQMSSICEEAGDHLEGLELLDPILASGLEALEDGVAVRLLRRAGVHHHRAGHRDDALRYFDRACERAKVTEGQLDELVFIDSELAELHTLTGQYEEAEEACRRGLTRLDRLRRSGRPGNEERTTTAATPEEDHLARMEVMLRGSAGHLDLRRLRLSEAKSELHIASSLARDVSTTAVQSLLLNNLGLVHGQRNELEQARACFERARRALATAGDRRGLVQILCNEALIVARMGDGVSATTLIEGAHQVLEQYPDRRLEYFTAQARATISYHVGDMPRAAQQFKECLPLGRDLGDEQQVCYGEIFLAEALLFCGQYGDAWRLLRSASKTARALDNVICERMLHARRMLVETLLGRSRSARASSRILEESPRSEIQFVESWNDLFVGLALCASGENATEPLTRAMESFEAMGAPIGRRMAQIGHLLDASARGDSSTARRLASVLEAEPSTEHRLLAVFEPLAVAIARLSAGDFSRATVSLDAAANAIVGLPFLELDWAIECGHSIAASHRGEHDAARMRLHRSLHTERLLAELVPGSSAREVPRPPRDSRRSGASRKSWTDDV